MYKFMRQIGMPMPKLLNYERYCFVAPHPDDIELGAGGTVARLKAMGKHVTFVIVTDGRYGGTTPDMAPEEVVRIRVGETKAAATHLGVDEVVMLGFCESGWYDYNEMKKQVALAVIKAEPDLIFTLDHLLPTELHPDHRLIGLAISDAFIHLNNHHYVKELGAQAPKRPVAGIAYFFTNRPNRYVKITKYRKLQMEALDMHKSQALPFGDKGKTNMDMFKIMVTVRNLRYGLRRFALQAEAFRVLSMAHTHVMPEVGEKSLFGNY